MHVMKFCAATAAAILFTVAAPGIATAQIEVSPAFRDDKPKRAPRRKAQPKPLPDARCGSAIGNGSDNGHGPRRRIDTAGSAAGRFGSECAERGRADRPGSVRRCAGSACDGRRARTRGPRNHTTCRGGARCADAARRGSLRLTPRRPRRRRRRRRTRASPHTAHTRRSAHPIRRRRRTAATPRTSKRGRRASARKRRRVASAVNRSPSSTRHRSPRTSSAAIASRAPSSS